MNAPALFIMIYLDCDSGEIAQELAGGNVSSGKTDSPLLLLLLLLLVLLLLLLLLSLRTASGSKSKHVRGRRERWFVARVLQRTTAT